jgi:hypothetical protein
MFGGKGNSIDFFDTGRELFSLMCRLEEKLKINSFFVMDENFLLRRERCLDLLKQMKRYDKSWSLFVFSSARVIQSYTIEELVGLGISWVWMGLEGENSSYAKLRGVDTRALIRNLQENGIRVLGSSIIGLETHTPENIDAVIAHSVAHNTDFHQFMLYTPVPGTPLYEEHRAKGTLLENIDEADTHGQYQFNFRHPHISKEQSEKFLLSAFQKDFEMNGPSIMRIARTTLEGWKKHKNHPDARVRARYEREAKIIPVNYASALWAMEQYFRKSNPHVAGQARDLLSEIKREFGLKSRLLIPIVGRIANWAMRREEKRLKQGWTYQPPTFVERANWDRPGSFTAEGMKNLVSPILSLPTSNEA